MRDQLVYNGFYGIEVIEREIKGRVRVFERLKIRNAVAALVIDSENKVGLVSQYRPCVNGYMLELPAGLMDKFGLDEREILIEELYEECGIHEKDIKMISSTPFANYYPLCGGSDTRLEIYLVFLNCKGAQKFVNDAEVEFVQWLDRKDIEILLRNNKIQDGKTLIGLNHYLYNLQA